MIIIIGFRNKVSPLLKPKHSRQSVNYMLFMKFYTDAIKSELLFLKVENGLYFSASTLTCVLTFLESSL